MKINMKNLNLKNNIFSKLFKVGVYFFAGLLFITSSVSAQTTPSISVTFSSNPLFNVSNFLPGDIETANVSIKNNTDGNQSAYVEAVTVVDPDGLASQMIVKIFNGANEIYSDNFDDFLNAGPVSLTNIGSGATTNYKFDVSFIDSADNDYMGKTLGFDLCFGFSGGSQYCTNTTSVGGEQGTGGGGGGGGTTTSSGGGGGNGPIQPQQLLIFNENAQNIGAGFVPEPTESATITWNTNIPATSQVVYGPDTSTYNFDINNLPGFGYPFWTTEDLTKVLNHSVVITGLIPGQTYVYRVVSRASPPTISYEHKFTVPLLAQNTNSGNSNQNGGAQSAVGVTITNSASADRSFDGDSNATNTEENLDNLALAFSAGDFISTCTIIAVLIIIAIYILWKVWLRPKYEKEGIAEDLIKNRFFIYYFLSTSIVSLVLVALEEYCPLPIVVFFLIISVIGYIYRKIILKK